MFKRFKGAVTAATEIKSEIRWITIASLSAGTAIPFMLYVAVCLSGLIEW